MAKTSMLMFELRAKAKDVSDPVTRRTYEDAISKLLELQIDTQDDLLHALASSTDAVLTACWIAGELLVHRAVPMLWKVIETRPEHAIEAAKAIVKLRQSTSESDAASFARLLQSSTVHPMVRVAAAYALGQIGSEVGITALVAFSRIDPNLRTFEAIARSP
jgi:HEAT repeat protein